MVIFFSHGKNDIISQMSVASELNIVFNMSGHKKIIMVGKTMKQMEKTWDNMTKDKLIWRHHVTYLHET